MTHRSLRILYVSCCWLHDRAFGGQLRALHIARALQELGSVTLVVVGAHEVGAEFRARTLAEFELGREIEAVAAPVRGVRSRLSSLLDPEFTNIHGMAVEEANEKWLKETARDFDLIWFSTLRTANLFSTARWPRSVVDIGDLPSSMHATATSSSGKSGGLKAAWRKLVLRQHEKRVSERFDVLAVCSEADRGKFSSAARIHVIPNGFSKPAQTPERKPAVPARIGFIGLLDYFANREGVSWFVENCLPRIRRKVSGVSLRLVGTGTDGPLKPGDDSVHGLGWVADPQEEISTWSLMIVPIRVGGGTRIKIADSFSRKCPVVATPLGAYGYDVRHGRELLLADKAEDFAAACLQLIEDPAAASAMAERAYAQFLENWTWEAIAPRVRAAANDASRRSR